ncbi:MAG: hypothetical protein ACRYGR_08560 [Janthinobacterium lividum]
MKKNNYTILIILTILFCINPCIGSNKLVDDLFGDKQFNASAQANVEFKGNWTDTFYLKNGSSFITHTPKYVSLDGFMTSKTAITLKSSSYNNMPLSKDGFNVQTNSSKEEFLEALIKSGIYEKN